jgi:hypothetical protein
MELLRFFVPMARSGPSHHVRRSRTQTNWSSCIPVLIGHSCNVWMWFGKAGPLCHGPASLPACARGFSRLAGALSNRDGGCCASQGAAGGGVSPLGAIPPDDGGVAPLLPLSSPVRQISFLRGLVWQVPCISVPFLWYWHASPSDLSLQAVSRAFFQEPTAWAGGTKAVTVVMIKTAVLKRIAGFTGYSFHRTVLECLRDTLYGKSHWAEEKTYRARKNRQCRISPQRPDDREGAGRACWHPNSGSHR